MARNLDVLVADSSGNITIMVLSPVDVKDYASIGQALLDNSGLGGEQVAFLVNANGGVPADAIDSESDSSQPHMDMCGLEFCGNASRAFALYEARRLGLLSASGFAETSVSVSGCEQLLCARVYDAEGIPASPASQSASDVNNSLNLGAIDALVEMDMPVPSKMTSLSADVLGTSKDGLLVDMDGIFHLILEDIAPSAELFDDIKHRLYDINPSMPALGVMFCDTVNHMMTPVVYVRDVDSTYFEGSCASGSVAASFAMAEKRGDGVHRFTMQQPEGALYTSVSKENGRIVGISLKGLVALSEVMQVQVL